MSSARKRKFRAGDGPFGQDGMAEAEQLGRPSDGIGGHCASLFNEFLLLDQAAKILLMNEAPCERFNTVLQLQEGELRRHAQQ